MFTSAINLSISDLIVLQVMAIVLGVVVYFVIVSRRKLQKMITESEEQISLRGSGSNYPLEPELPKRPAVVHEKRKTFSIDDVSPLMARVKGTKPAPAAPAEAFLPEVIYSLKDSIQQQQKSLNQLLMKVDQLSEDELQSSAKDEVEALEIMLEQKDAELHKVRHQLATAQKMAGRIEEVYREFDALHQKIASLEEQARHSNELAIEANDFKQSYAQVKKELARKQEKLQLVVEENQALHSRLGEAEKKLSEANLQCQQLMKRIQYLENTNTELYQISDANKKMQNELRRIGELESMLSMVSDERDILLKKRIQS